jgi:hypothetical protein
MSELSKERYVVRVGIWAWNVYQLNPPKLVAALSHESPDAERDARILANKLNRLWKNETTSAHACGPEANPEFQRQSTKGQSEPPSS